MDFGRSKCSAYASQLCSLLFTLGKIFFQIHQSNNFSDKKQKIAIARKLCLEALEKEKAAIENEYSARLNALKEDLEKIDYSKVKKLVCKIYHKSGTVVTLKFEFAHLFKYVVKS